MICETPANRSGTRKAPPPTAISGTSPASVFMRSIFSSSCRVASASAAAIMSLRDRATRERSPISSSPAATAISVAVNVCAAEHKCVLRQPVADAERADANGSVDMAAAAEPDRQQVGHPEQRAHAADLDDGIGLARKAVAKLADIGGCTADVHDHRVVEPGQMRRAAHGVGGAGGKAHHREGGWPFRPASPCRRSGSGTAAHRCRFRRSPCGRPRPFHGEIVQRGVEKRRVLPLEQADPAKIVRQRHGDVRADLPGYRARRSRSWIERGEDRRDATERSPSRRCCRRPRACRRVSNG